MKHRTKTATLLLSACLSVPAISQSFYSQVELLPSPSAYPTDPFAHLGHACELDGQDLFVTSKSTTWSSNRDGIVFHFRRVGSAWTFVSDYKSPLSGAQNEFGTAIDVHDGLMVSTAPGWRHPGNVLSGAAFLIEESAGTWTLNSLPITAPNPSGSDNFGSSVATNGTWIAVGADLDDAQGNNAGAVHLYQQAVPKPIYHSTLYSPTPLAGSLFGSRMCMEGSRLAISSPQQNSGVVEIFELNGTWQHAHTITPQVGNGLDAFGASLDLDGDRIAIGAPGAGNGGAFEVYSFASQVPAWFIESRANGLPQTWTAKFGYSIALDGNRLVVGATETTISNSRHGAAYVFERHGGGTWTMGKRLVPAGVVHGDLAGEAVGLKDGTLVVTSLREVLWSGHSGSVAIFEESDGAFREFGPGDGSAGACPCGNESLPTRQQGCSNSGGLGAQLCAQGGVSVAADDLRLHAFNLIPGNPVILFSGVDEFLAPIPMGDGLRFTGTQIVRLGIRVPSPAGKATWGTGLAAAYGWQSGQAIHVQAWYRDTVGTPCGSGFNLSGGIAVNLQP